MSRTRKLGIVLLVAAAVVATLRVSAPKLKWRAQLVSMKATGELVDVTWGDVIEAIVPGTDTHLNLSNLLTTGSPYKGIGNPHETEEDRRLGADIFRSECASCHGIGGTGPTGPDLTTGPYRYGISDWALFKTISEGIPGTAMQGLDVAEDSIWRLVTYVRWLAADAAEEDSAAVAPPPRVTFERLVDASDEPQNWLTYGGDYTSRRFSRLVGIDRENVRQLELLWVRQLYTSDAHVETSPLVVDDVMFITEPPSNILALDARTGHVLCRYTRSVPRDLRLCCGRINRGAAVLGNRVFLGTMDAHLVALDARNGNPLWDTEVADYETGYSITTAPLAVKDKVLIGVAGGEFGIRGFLDAYDAASGKRMWRFYTVPGPGEPGHDTWEGESWRTGGGPTWMTGSYDPELDLIYWGTGNPAPPWNGGVRRGDNLYTNSVVALDADSGEIEWHFQFLPHDVHDLDANQAPVLVDRDYHGEPRELMLWANKNAFFYVLDRRTGEFLLGGELAEQTWAAGLDSVGRPIPRPEADPSPQGTLVSPGGQGGTNWWLPSYSPATGLFYVPVIPSSASVHYTGRDEYEPGKTYLGSGILHLSAQMPEKAIRAFDPETGKVVWEYRFPPLTERGASVEDRFLRANTVGGTLATAGDLVFAGADDLFVAVDARSGDLLWKMMVGGQIIAPPVTCLTDSRQQVTVAAGRALFTFALPAR